MAPATEKDKQIAAVAAHLFSGRDPVADFGSVLVDLDHLIAVVMLSTQDGDKRKSAMMFNEGVVPAVEERIAAFRMPT